MTRLIGQMLVTGLAASVSPIAIILITDILSLKNPVKKSLAFFAGFAATLVFLGTMVVLVLQVALSTLETATKLKAYIDIALGLVCFGLLFRVFRKRPGKKKSAIIGDEMKPRRAFIIGCVAMITNASTLVIYVSGVHSIAEAKLGIGGDVVLLAILTMTALITVVLPVLLYLLSPNTAGKILGRIGGWLNKHHKAVAAGILIIFGFYLVIRGVRAI